MAPEVLRKKHHGPVSDYFAIGVMLHEFLKGRRKRPYIARDRNAMRSLLNEEEV